MKERVVNCSLPLTPSIRGGIKRKIISSFLSVGFLLSGIRSLAQDGNTGINEANTKVRSYFDAGTNLMYAVGALVGLIGAVKV